MIIPQFNFDLDDDDFEGPGDPCEICHGWGLWADDDIPMTREEAAEGFISEVCPSCGADNPLGDIPVDLVELEDVDDSHHEDYLTMVKRIGEIACAASSDTSEKRPLVI